MADSNQTKTELDLDLLERQIDHPQMPVQLGAKLHSVIQRLREAEARTSLGDEQIIDEQDAAIKRLTARIDRLERVPAAAIAHLPYGTSGEELRAALAALGDYPIDRSTWPRK